MSPWDFVGPHHLHPQPMFPTQETQNVSLTPCLCEQVCKLRRVYPTTHQAAGRIHTPCTQPRQVFLKPCRPAFLSAYFL